MHAFFLYARLTIYFDRREAMQGGLGGGTVSMRPGINAGESYVREVAAYFLVSMIFPSGTLSRRVEVERCHGWVESVAYKYCAHVRCGM